MASTAAEPARRGTALRRSGQLLFLVQRKRIGLRLSTLVANWRQEAVGRHNYILRHSFSLTYCQAVRRTSTTSRAGFRLFDGERSQARFLFEVSTRQKQLTALHLPMSRSSFNNAILKVFEHVAQEESATQASPPPVAVIEKVSRRPVAGFETTLVLIAVGLAVITLPCSGRSQGTTSSSRRHKYVTKNDPVIMG